MYIHRFYDMALKKMTDPQLDLRESDKDNKDKKKDIPKIKPEEVRSAHAEEFLSRITRIEQTKGLTEGMKQADSVKITESEKPATAKAMARQGYEAKIDLKDKGREASTEKKLDNERSEKIKSLKEKVKELQEAIEGIDVNKEVESKEEKKGDAQFPDKELSIDLEGISVDKEETNKPEALNLHDEVNTLDLHDVKIENNKKEENTLDLRPEKETKEKESEIGYKERVEVHNLTSEVEEQKNLLKFPPGFLWGTASSAYQVEGGIENNWSRWEKSPKRKAELNKKGEDEHDFICGDACDSYNRYEEDFKLAKKMHNNCIRLGIEWARIQPRSNTWNVYALKHYRKMLETAKEKGFTTFVTLWHWTEPNWFTKKEAWEKEENVKRFLRYVDLAIKELGANIDYWVVLNEPIMNIFGGYLRAYHPPQKRSLKKAEKVFKNLVKAHKESYRLIHDYFPDANVGCANMLNYFEPADKWNPLERMIAGGANWYWNKRFLNKIKDYQDYVGVNYYFHDRMIWLPPFRLNENKWVNDNGWEIYPEGMYHVLKLAHEYKKPIFITENGLSDKDDKHRVKFIKEHLQYVHKAIEEGIDVQGYMHWSLLDNFEWSYGWKLKFGLHEVDRKTFKRTARPSALEYGKICKNNEVEIE
jgi:beta-glucosidase